MAKRESSADNIVFIGNKPVKLTSTFWVLEVGTE